MRTLSKAAVPLAGSAALLIAMTGTALASGTITSDGSPYTGNVTATNIGPVAFTGPATITCDDAAIKAHVTSTGAVQITGVALTGCTSGSGATIAVPVPPGGLSGSIGYDPGHVGGRDGVLTVSGAEVDVTVPVLGGLKCAYGSTLTAALFNPDNPSKPAPSNPHGQAAIPGASLTLSSGGFLCSSTLSINALFQVVTAPTAADLVIGP
jgi:hypothetical protein